MSEQKTIYYPHPKDIMWNDECEKLIPYLAGKGVDIGAGGRSIFKEDVRVDLDKKTNPDVCCSGDELPFKDNEFDYLYSIHSFEHFEDQRKLLKEWCRVVRKGGIIAIVHPDVEYTGVRRPDGLKPSENPYNEHKHERTLDDFLYWFKSQRDLPLRVIDFGEARIEWSFYVILKRL